MGFYRNQVVPRLVDLTCGSRRLEPVRRRALAGLRGTVLEVGFGSGLNVPHYPAAVDRVLAVEPNALARRRAEQRVVDLPVPVTFVGLDGEAIDLPDGSVDSAVSTWTLCTIPDAVAALDEVARVLRPGGTLAFLEHGRADDEVVAARQQRYTPLQRRLAGGCHLDRDIGALVEQSALELGRVETFTVPGPKVASFMYLGHARAG